MQNRLTYILCLLFSTSLLAGSRVININDGYSHKKNWTRIKRTESESLQEVVKVLRRSRTGEKILFAAIGKARKVGQTLENFIKPGSGSLTDTTLIRKFSASRPDKVMYESKSTVFINRDLSMRDAVLDLAHELTHFVHRSPFNPYTQNFNLPDFVKSTVEGKGGEVDAFMVECRVLNEIYPNYKRQAEVCGRIKDKSHRHLSKKMAVNEFYRVGPFYRSFVDSLRRHAGANVEIPKASDGQAYFISSAYGKPYPVAAVEEYVTIMTKACSNDQKRLEIMFGRLGRFPANDEQHSVYSTLSKSYHERCQNYTVATL